MLGIKGDEKKFVYFPFLSVSSIQMLTSTTTIPGLSSRQEKQATALIACLSSSQIEVIDKDQGITVFSLSKCVQVYNEMSGKRRLVRNFVKKRKTTSDEEIWMDSSCYVLIENRTMVPKGEPEPSNNTFWVCTRDTDVFHALVKYLFTADTEVDVIQTAIALLGHQEKRICSVESLCDSFASLCSHPDQENAVCRSKHLICLGNFVGRNNPMH
jgi:hypothetical protein